MTTGDIARSLGISTTTVRKWADVFGEFLSDDATPAYGEIRNFSEDDLQVLSVVAFYRKQQRLTFEQILEKLRRGDHLTDPIPTPRPPAAEQPAPAPPAQGVEALWHEVHRLADAQHALQTSLTERLDGLERHLEAGGPLPGLVEELREHRQALRALQERLHEIHGALASREQMERQLAGLQALVDHLDHLHEELATREQVEQFREELQHRLELEGLRTLVERFEELREVLPTSQQVEQLEEELRQRLEGLQVLPERLDEIRGASATGEQVEQFREEIQPRLEALQASLERLVDVREALATREQVERLGQNLQQPLDELRALLLLLDRIDAIQVEITAIRQELHEHISRPRAPGRLAESAIRIVQVLSWAILLLAALGGLYYLDLGVWPSVLLAVLITSALWLTSRAVLQ